MKFPRIDRWTEDELIECIDLYNTNPLIKNENDPAIVAMSIKIQEESKVPVQKRSKGFRSTSSIHKKYQCWAGLDNTNPKAGLTNIAKEDIELFNELGDQCYAIKFLEANPTPYKSCLSWK